MTYFLHYKN